MLTTTYTFAMDDTLISCLEQRLGDLLRAKRVEALTEEREPEIARISSALAGGVLMQGPCVVLMTGMPGAGKTTLALALARAGFKRLCPDEEMFRRYGRYGVDFPRGSFGFEKLLSSTTSLLNSALSWRLARMSWSTTASGRRRSGPSGRPW